jgi:hypothetical protein
MTRGPFFLSAIVVSLLWTLGAALGSELAPPPNGVPPERDLKDEKAPIPISLEIDMPLKKIGPQDDLVVNGKVKNLSDKDLPFYDTAEAWLRFQEKSTKQVWVRQSSLFPPPPGAPPRLQTWKAGEVRNFSVRLPPQTKYGHQGAKPDSARVGLPPGKYLLFCEMSYLDHYPELKKNAVEGTLTPAPIEFEVVGE